MTEKALRYNEGKLDWTLLDFDSIKPLVEVMTYGATKYARENWKLPCDNPREHLKSAMRHLLSLFNGDEFDFDPNCEECKTGKCGSHSGKRHSGHIMANMMMYNFHTKNIK
jgi:hypothetical protein